MSRIFTSVLVITTVLLTASAAAFEWSAQSFPDGDQRYVLEFRMDSSYEQGTSTMEIDIKDLGGRFDVRTSVSVREEVPKDEMDIMGLGGLSDGFTLLGPAMMFGPMFMFLPMMLEGQDIRVRSEPLVLLGFGEMHMERTERVAGHECVVIRFVPTDSDDVFEFALAEGVPFPCFSRYGSEGDITEMRLISTQ